MTNKTDKRLIARSNELRVLKMIFKFGYLRSRDIAALIWTKSIPDGNDAGFAPLPITVKASALRMGQRTLKRLLAKRHIIVHEAPDGSWIYGVSEAGARFLRDAGVPASSCKNWMRQFSSAQYYHRRISTEVGIVALLQGYRVSSEREIASGLWFGGLSGIGGKKPDVIVRSGKDIWWVEVERSRRNQPDYRKLLDWLDRVWSLPLGEAYQLKRIVFICSPAFWSRLTNDLARMGWSQGKINQRIVQDRSLYSSEGQYLTIR